MDSEYILQTIRPYVVESQMTYADFERAFGFLDRREQYAVIRFIEDELKIFFVDELLTNAQPLNETDSTVLRRAEEIRESNRILLELVKSGDEQAKQDLIVKNSGLVMKSARYYYEKFPCSLELDDLIQEGNLGMLKAAQRFDFGKRTQFSTYATWWIVQAISRAIMNTGQVISLPVHITEKIVKATKLDVKFQMQGFSPRRRIELIAETMEISTERVRELFEVRNAYMNLKSLDMPVDAESDTKLLELIPDRQQSLDNSVAFIELKERIRDVLESLTPREKAVLMLRFGLYDGHDRTLEEIGQTFNVTRERIRQIEAKALKKLRHPTRSKKLRDFLEGEFS